MTIITEQPSWLSDAHVPLNNIITHNPPVSVYGSLAGIKPTNSAEQKNFIKQTKSLPRNKQICSANICAHQFLYAEHLFEIDLKTSVR